MESEEPEKPRTLEEQFGPAPAHTEEQLKEIAVGIHRNEIFTSRHIRAHDEHLLPNIFMASAFAGPDLPKWMVKHKVEVLFAKMSEAAPMAINGYPHFFGNGFLTVDQWSYVLNIITFLEEAEKVVLEK